jgi:hypothetical protein
MISSEGKGMHADSIAIRIAMPAYPVVATTLLMKMKTIARIRSVIEKKFSVLGSQLSVKTDCGFTEDYELRAVFWPFSVTDAAIGSASKGDGNESSADREDFAGN